MGESDSIKPGARADSVIWSTAFALAVIAAHSIPFFQYAPGDIAAYVQPWYRHIFEVGRIEAFGQPFSNYTPPYLYLLSALTIFHGSMAIVYQIKLLALAGALWIVFASWRLFRTLGVRPSGALGVLLLPSIVFNASLLGQADTFWVAPCILALTAGIRERWFWVAFWSGVAFAFKAQAVFFAPFVIYLFLKNRAPVWLWLVPPVVYVLAMAPAWLAGWPVWLLLTTYVRQVSEPFLVDFVSDSASWWTLFGYAAHSLALKSFWFGLVTAALGAIAYWYFMPKLTGRALIAAAALSAAGLPFLLPSMHERFFILADVLVFLYAWAKPSRNTIFAAILMQLASALPVAAWAFRFQHAEVAAPFYALGALLILWEEVAAQASPAPSREPKPSLETLPDGNPC